MNIRPTLPAFLMATFAILSLGLGACGGGGSGHDTTQAPSPPPSVDVSASPDSAKDGDTNASGSSSSNGAAALSDVDCDAAWTQYVALHPVGLVVGYKTSSVTKGEAGNIIQSSESSYEETVLDSNVSSVTTVRLTQVEGVAKPAQTKSTLFKVQFVLGCNQLKGALAGQSLNGLGKIIEKSTQTVTVSSGTYSADYILGQTSSLSTGTTTFQNWSLNDGSAILIKNVLETKTDVDGATMTGTIATELTKLVRP